MYGVGFEELQEILREIFGEGGAAAEPVLGPCSEWRPCGLYHTMLEPTAPYGIRGFLWYQGENDEPHADIYETVLRALILRWRRLWGRDDLPFILTQFAPLSESANPTAANFPVIRRAQQAVADTVDRVFCTTAGDVGNFHDIHPKVKQPVGHRMALLALGHVYGQGDLLCEAPVAVSAGYADGALEIRFRDGQGLHRSSADPLPLTVRAEGADWDEGNGLEVCIQDDTLRISSRALDLRRWEKVSMGETPYYVMNLINGADIPAKPFTLACKGEG